MNFEQKKKFVRARGVEVRKEEVGPLFLWFCPNQCWMGYFETEEEAWEESFSWFNLSPMTNARLKIVREHAISQNQGYAPATLGAKTTSAVAHVVDQLREALTDEYGLDFVFEVRGNGALIAASCFEHGSVIAHT